MIIYRYDENTKEYLGYAEAYLDPLETIKAKRDVYVIPPCFTVKEPLEQKDGFVNVYKEGEWVLIKDNRGLQGYNKRTGEDITIFELGELPDYFVLEKPINLSQLKSVKTKEIEVGCDRAQREEVKFSTVSFAASSCVELSIKLSSLVGFNVIPLDNGIISRKELEKIVKYLYLRSILLNKKKEELMKELSSLKSKKKIQEFLVDFNVDSEIQSMMELSTEEINKVFSEEQ